MKIIYTKHAKIKFEVLEKHGFAVTKNQVEGTIDRPDKVVESRKGRLIAQKPINKNHLLRVIYRKKGDTIRVITFYPARRYRYEG